MKNLRKDIKRILRNECLTKNEKIQLKSFFKKFIYMRDILSRKPIDFELEEDQCFGLDDILRRSD